MKLLLVSVHSLNPFTPPGAGSDGGMILVGKCLLRIEKKLLKPSEELKVELQNPTAVTDVERVKDKTLVEQLDQGLWYFVYWL